jgi:hypothetical protein
VVEELSVQHIELLSKELTEKVNAKLAEVKDGEPGRDGKDADIKPLVDMFEAREVKLADHFDELESTIKARVDACLAEVKDGKDGEPGPQGLPGKDGKDGKLPIAREWTNRVHYEGDVVRHAGSTYQALTDTGQQPPHSDWGELASRGTDGRGFVLRGLYNATVEYRQHDIVMISRNSFAAKYDNPGECPGEGWQLFACLDRQAPKVQTDVQFRSLSGKLIRMKWFCGLPTVQEIPLQSICSQSQSESLRQPSEERSASCNASN